MTDRERDLDKKRMSFLKTQSEILGIMPQMWNVKPVTQEIKDIFSQKLEGYMEISPEPFVYEKYITPAEKCKDEDISKVGKAMVAVNGKGVATAPADIFFADTIPLKHMVLTPRIYPGDKCIDRYDFHVVDDDERRKNIQSLAKGEIKEAVVMWARHTVYKKTAGVQGWVRLYQRFVIERDKDYIAQKSTVYYESSKNFEQGIKFVMSMPSEVNKMVGESYTCLFEVYNAWYTLQQCILTKQLAGYVKSSKSTLDYMKTGYVTNDAKKKINKYIIQFEKIQEVFSINADESGSDPDKRKYRKPLWHVTGHWRHYKSGKVTFVQGYWKGSERDNPDINVAPVEISIDDWLATNINFSE